MSREFKFEPLDQWIKTLSETGHALEIDPELLREFFELHGANFEPSEELKTLEEYSNKARAVGMRKVWGDRYDEYKKWTLKMIPLIEAEIGKDLPS